MIRQASHDALAAAIPLLKDAAKNQARAALAERLARMTPHTLRGKLQDEQPEIRRAAALASAMKEDRGFVPDLIRLLQDPEPRVSRAAHAALKTIARTDFGPANADSPEQRDEAIKRWKEWWEKKNSQ